MKWILICSKPKEEIKAKINLEYQGLETLLPLIEKNNTKSKLGSLEAIFPGYLFVKIDANSSKWLSIKSTKGVRNIVTFGSKHAIVPEKIINSLSSKLDKQGIFHPKLHKSNFQKDTKLIINRGRFSGIEAIVLEKSSKQRVKLLFEYLNKRVITYVPLKDIQYPPTVID